MSIAAKPPSHLSAAAKRWFREISATYGICDRAGALLLAQAAECWDRANECRERIAKEGATVLDRFGQSKAHPLTAVERDARQGFRAALKLLNLDIAAIPSGERGNASRNTA